MPYLVLIGDIPSNLSQVGARGYRVVRHGKRVDVEWGRIGVDPIGQAPTFYWARRRCYKSYRLRTEEAARRFAKAIVLEKIELKGYTVLKGGRRIRSGVRGKSEWRNRCR